jgi:hypothetical protein
MRFFERRAERRELAREAAELLPRVALLKHEVAERSLAVREEFRDLPGFPPLCERCDVVMLYRRVQLGRKKWRWMWRCPQCSQQVFDAAFKERQADAR